VSHEVRLKSVDAVRDFQRRWLEQARRDAEAGEPFVICNSDEFEEVLNVMGIPVLVINYWNNVVVRDGKAAALTASLRDRGYQPSFFALGLASALDPANAPWGGLPPPALILGSARSETDLRVTELWARAAGCPCYALDFGFTAPFRQLEPADWRKRLRADWMSLVDADRLALRMTQNLELIGYLERLTGRTFDPAGLERAMTALNEQMDSWMRATDLIAGARPCPVSLRDQMAVYQVMWHRGTDRATAFLASYEAEVRERVRARAGAYESEQVRLLYWGDREPGFHRYLQAAGVVFAGCLYSSTPQAYARDFVPGDALRALAARHLLLFERSPDWPVEEAVRHQCDGVIGVEAPSAVPSGVARACAAAGLPYLAVPRETDDAEIRALLDPFVASVRGKAGAR
jgi:benzoyl-CoA reductase subunit B